MISFYKYVPILKCKAGEFTALTKLSPDIMDEIIPLYDLVPPGNKKFDKHIDDSINYIRKWDKEHLFFIDGYLVQEFRFLSSRVHPMEYIFNTLHKEKYNVIPIISNATGLEYNTAVKKIITRYPKGVCLRIFRKSVDEMNNAINQLLGFLELDPSSIDLVIDMRSLLSVNTLELYIASVNILQNINYLNNWRSLVLAGSSFPIDLVELKPDQVHPLERKEWSNWVDLLLKKEIERFPAFADYGISHPLLSKIVTDFPNASASIRYTCESDFYVYRGRGTRERGFKQFNVLSEALIYSDEYYGVDHCAGDRFINTCGTKKEKPGSLQTWRWVGTCHHLTVVANQLRQFLRDFNPDLTS